MAGSEEAGGDGGSLALLLALPLTFGRCALGLAQFPLLSDVYALATGGLLLWAAAVAAHAAHCAMRANPIGELAGKAVRTLAVGAEVVAHVLLWLGLAPFLLGRLFELLVMAPLRTERRQSACVCVPQDWAIGLLYLKVGVRMLLLPAMRAHPWGAALTQALDGGLGRDERRRILSRVLLPLLWALARLLALPYALIHGLGAIVPLSALQHALLRRFAWHGVVALAVLRRLLPLFAHASMALHDSVRDEHYLLGTRLQNHAKHSSAAAEVTSVGTQAALKTVAACGSCRRRPPRISSATPRPDAALDANAFFVTQSVQYVRLS
eukprot:CAMPEP_0179848074 /NCGR_PEP_ID=MMETSP0982-20121206/6430_1 /TAXON_ID=483367 /ORGANISM="non described non described, Strain CCMP 2436" /LENGTH=322 /DNA_ID=CAMNT_0021733317 /DNA_START=113 /DNA_END=1081 /DNA_ORIENTATION=+